MLVTNNMEVTNKPMAAMPKDDNGARVQEQTAAQTADQEIEVAISAANINSSILTEDELNSALENVLASQSSVMDVEQADSMIREALGNIYTNADDSVLAQANQTPPMVAELTK